VNRRRLSVLVVDDEREIRQLLTDILAGAGHEVSCASDGASACLLVADRARHFDLAFVDFVMPGEDGISLIRHLREIRPSMAAVLLTGNTAISLAPAPDAGGPIGIITKPFGLAAVEEVVAATAGASQTT
jgi:two-component system response regulator AtoC